MIWTELYRPKTLKDFIGNRNVVKVSKRWLEGWWEGKAILPILILHGRSGIGKTTLSHCLGAEYGCAISELNASDERNVKNMRKAIQTTGISGLDTKRRLTIFDEADSMSKAAQKLLVDKVKLVKQPVILLVNDMTRINRELKNISMVLEMKKPTKMEKLDLAKEIIEIEGAFDILDMKSIVESSESFRDLLNNIFFGVYGSDFADDYEDDHLGLIGAMMRGQIGSERLKISPDELLRYVYQNKINPTLRDVDVWLTICKRSGNYKLWAHSFAILELQRHDGAIKIPRSEFKKSDTKKPVKKVAKKPAIKSRKIHTKNVANPKSAGLLSYFGEK